MKPRYFLVLAGVVLFVGTLVIIALPSPAPVLSEPNKDDIYCVPDDALTLVDGKLLRYVTTVPGETTGRSFGVVWLDQGENPVRPTVFSYPNSAAPVLLENLKTLVAENGRLRLLVSCDGESRTWHLLLFNPS